ncbi:MAG: AAA domain-containing protein [Bacteroides sp.]|nr:AAA domain-containing protein [Bacteroides sp.]
MEMSPEEKWNECCRLLSEKLSRQEFDHWFRPIRFHSYNETSLSLNVPSAEFQAQLEATYLPLLANVLRSVFGPDVKLFYEYSTNKHKKLSPRKHIASLIKWMSQGVYEKEQIIAMALLCAVAGENMFLLGPPGTAKSMVASRLKKVFRGGKSFDYLMSRFSTPDEIFGPISISRLKNEDRYERLTAGYLPEADVVFLDEIWKAGPSIQNTLLTVINEHIFHNGGQVVRTPLKVLIAASNELPAKDEGLEALWDRFLVRMVSNCIESDAAFFKMIKGADVAMSELSEPQFITDEVYSRWQQESKTVDIQESVICAIKALRKSLAELEKEDGHQLRYYISDRRWRKAYRLMQTSAYLNGRNEINLTDYLLLIHSFWNDVECIPNVLNAFTSSISDSILKELAKIDKSIRRLMTPQKPTSQQEVAPRLSSDSVDFAEFDYFYYLIENYPGGDTYFSKWDYAALSNQTCDGVQYFEHKLKKNIIHTLIPGRPFVASTQNSGKLTKVKIQKCRNGALINGTPYAFKRKNSQVSVSYASTPESSVNQRVAMIQKQLKAATDEWQTSVAAIWADNDNLFLSANDLALINKMLNDVNEQIKTIEVKLNNIITMVK